MRPSVAEMARRAITSWSERIDLVLEDLAALPADGGIVAEGPGVFPEVLAPLLPSPRTRGGGRGHSWRRRAIRSGRIATTSSGTS